MISYNFNLRVILPLFSCTSFQSFKFSRCSSSGGTPATVMAHYLPSPRRCVVSAVEWAFFSFDIEVIHTFITSMLTSKRIVKQPQKAWPKRRRPSK